MKKGIFHFLFKKMKKVKKKKTWKMKNGEQCENYKNTFSYLTQAQMAPFTFEWGYVVSNVYT